LKDSSKIVDKIIQNEEKQADIVTEEEMVSGEDEQAKLKNLELERKNVLKKQKNELNKKKKLNIFLTSLKNLNAGLQTIFEKSWFSILKFYNGSEIVTIEQLLEITESIIKFKKIIVPILSTRKIQLPLTKKGNIRFFYKIDELKILITKVKDGQESTSGEHIQERVKNYNDIISSMIANIEESIDNENYKSMENYAYDEFVNERFQDDDDEFDERFGMYGGSDGESISNSNSQEGSEETTDSLNSISEYVNISKQISSEIDESKRNILKMLNENFDDDESFFNFFNWMIRVVTSDQFIEYSMQNKEKVDFVHCSLLPISEWIPTTKNIINVFKESDYYSDPNDDSIKNTVESFLHDKSSDVLDLVVTELNNNPPLPRLLNPVEQILNKEKELGLLNDISLTTTLSSKQFGGKMKGGVMFNDNPIWRFLRGQKTVDGTLSIIDSIYNDDTYSRDSKYYCGHLVFMKSFTDYTNWQGKTENPTAMKLFYKYIIFLRTKGFNDEADELQKFENSIVSDIQYNSLSLKYFYKLLFGTYGYGDVYKNMIEKDKYLNTNIDYAKLGNALKSSFSFIDVTMPQIVIGDVSIDEKNNKDIKNNVISLNAAREENMTVSDILNTLEPIKKETPSTEDKTTKAEEKSLSVPPSEEFKPSSEETKTKTEIAPSSSVSNSNTKGHAVNQNIVLYNYPNSKIELMFTEYTFEQQIFFGEVYADPNPDKWWVKKILQSEKGTPRNTMSRCIGNYSKDCDKYKAIFNGLADVDLTDLNNTNTDVRYFPEWKLAYGVNNHILSDEEIKVAREERLKEYKLGGKDLLELDLAILIDKSNQ
jgi:hypothetical protein